MRCSALQTGLLFIGGLLIPWLFFGWVAAGLQPVAGKEVTVLLPVVAGSSVQQVATLLYKKHLIRNKRIFRWWAQGKLVKAGEYKLSSTMSVEELLTVLERGKTILYRLTIPEGFASKEIALLLEKQGIVSAASFVKACVDQQLLASLGLHQLTAEGYLFPETYYFPRGMHADQVVKKMVAEFNRHMVPAWRLAASRQGKSLHEIVTLASIIEKETGKASERPLIASVFYNRLQQRERLYSDPTVLFALGRSRGRLTKKDLAVDSPYNTYKNRGIPPGPIANPGADALRAALFPAVTDYHYFVSKNDGSHQFNKTLSAHNQAVYRYQKVKK